MTSKPTAPDAPAAIRLTPSVTAAPYGHPDARRLTQALRAEQLGLYGFADDPATTPEADWRPHGPTRRRRQPYSIGLIRQYAGGH